jgi:transcriptional regulator
VYQPPHFREDRLEVQHALIEARSLGILITAGADGIEANPIPFIIDRKAAKLGVLRAHLAKANPQWRLFKGDAEALVVFQDVDTYVSPAWYPSKREHAKVVPTWNYAMVQVWGRPRLMATGEELREQLDALTHRHESERADPWAVNDAPADFIAAQMKGIVGVEIEIARIEGKWKVSQNRNEADRLGVAEGLIQERGEAAASMSALVRARGG